MERLTSFINNYSQAVITAILIISVLAEIPYSTRQEAAWRLECELGMIADAECPVDGGWAPWSQWSACHGLCDDTGHRRRTRKCDNPPPSKDGTSCKGLAEQIEPCYLTNCTVDDFKKLVEGDAVREQALRQLETCPAVTERCLQTECPFEVIEAVTSEKTCQVSPESVWNALQCVKHNLGCPVFGEWGPWGGWSTCGARCGSGHRWRIRRCDNPPPSEAHLVCDGYPLEAHECEDDQCVSDEFESSRNVSGFWGEWGTWSHCSETCAVGVQRRRRYCKEMSTQPIMGTWQTHCRGQYEQLEVCLNPVCVLHGGWSAWSAWGPCSQTCDAGRRVRSRSCTRPMPTGGGQTCPGPKTEVGACHLAPCQTYTHTVATFNGESHLQYDFAKKTFTLFHFYIRFLSYSSYGNLVRRGNIQSPHIRLSLQKWHICLDASGSSRACGLPRVCSTEIIEPAVWHSALLTVTNEAASLRLDDSTAAIRRTFPCDPVLLNEVVNIFVGEKFHGEIQELIVNFIPLNIGIDRDRRMRRVEFLPTSVSNIAYEKSNTEEAYLNLDNDQYMRLPCFENQDEWQVKITLKPKLDSGTVLFMRNVANHVWLHLTLINNRLKLKLASGDLRSESSSSELLLDQWLDVNLSKRKETDKIEACINAGERLHVMCGEVPARSRRNPFKFNNKQTSKTKQCNGICEDEFFLGGLPHGIKRLIAEDFTPFNGVVASVTINGVLQDLHDNIVERYIDDRLQVSSRSASVSGSYHETAWGSSKTLNLTCLHTRSIRNLHSAHWLFLDTAINQYIRDKMVRSVDDGKVLRLHASADGNLRGFYTCRALTKRRTRNIVTYGVVGKIHYQMKGPEATTVIAVFTTVALVAVSLLWLFIEGVHDLRNGYGFYRDAHFTPEEEADAVCKFIDDNMHLIGSKTEAELAKARARRKAEGLASKVNFGAQEPQGMMQEANYEDKSSQSDTDTLPVTPEATNTSIDQSPQNTLRCELSSPRHGYKFSSPSSIDSSLEITSPRALCSRLLMSKRVGSGESSLSRNTKPCLTLNSSRMRSNTVKSSAFVNYSPAHKVLQKFRQLKSEDV